MTQTGGPTPTRPGALVVASVMAAVAAVGVTTTAMGVVARPLADDVGADAVQLGWAVNAYLVVAAALSIVGARLGDRYGRRRIFGLGCAVFAVGSLVAAATPGLSLLVVGRLLQGVGAALLLPSSIEVIAVTLSGHAERRALLIRGTTFSVAFGVGPLVGGLVGQSAGWRWVFVLVAVLAASAAAMILPGARAVTRGEVWRDPVGVVLSVVGVVVVVLVAELGRAWSGLVAGVTAGVVAAVAVIGFVAWERRQEAPLVHPSLLRDRQVAGGDLATFASALGMLGLLYFFGIYARSAATLGWSALSVALALIPFALSLALLGLLAGWLGRHLGRAVPVVFGMGLMAIGFLVLSRTSVDASDADVLVPLAICGIGAGIANACVTRPAVLSVDRHRLGEAAGVASLARFAGTALALAIGTTHLPRGGEPPGGHDPTRHHRVRGRRSRRRTTWSSVATPSSGRSKGSMPICGHRSAKRSSSTPSRGSPPRCAGRGWSSPWPRWCRAGSCGEPLRTARARTVIGHGAR